MSAYEELRRAAQASPYLLSAESVALADALESASERYTRVEGDVGLGGLTGAAAAAQAHKLRFRAVLNGDAVRFAAFAINDANLALARARDDFASLPSVDVPPQVVAELLAGGLVLLGPAGSFTGAAGVAFLGATLQNKREREAIEAIVRLCASLSAAAERLLGEAAKIEVPAGAKPDSIPDYPEDRAERRLTPWQLGAEWLGKGGENRRFFREGDAFTELLRSHPFYDRMRADLHQLARDGKLQIGDSSDVKNGVLYSDINNVYSLGGVEGVGKYVIDYSTLLTGGLTGNLAVTYLGSHVAEVTVIGVNPDGSYEVRITVSNESSLESATRIPKIGYEDWYKDSVGSFWNDVAENTGFGTTTKQEITWTETIYP